jgi:hypothetical protein
MLLLSRTIFREILTHPCGAGTLAGEPAFKPASLSAFLSLFIQTCAC